MNVCSLKNKAKMNSLACHLCGRVIILKTGFLLEWSFRCCLPPVCNLHQLRLLRRDTGQLSPLCGGKLLGLCPYPLLIVHPVLTGTHKQGGKDIFNLNTSVNEVFFVTEALHYEHMTST